MLSFLRKPHPYLRNYKRNILTNFCIGVFIAFFLIVFQPFDIDLWITEHKFLKLIGFGAISFVVPTLISFLIEWIVPRSVLEDTWKIWHEVLALIVVLCGIALGNLVFGNYLNITQFTFEAYLSALLIVLTVGIFPITFYVLRSQNRLLKINLEQAKQVNAKIEAVSNERASEEKNAHLVISSENEKDKLIINPSQLLYIESADNYSNIVFTEQGQKKKVMIRSSLKRIESQLNSPAIMRCHRTFIVNLKNVKHIDGNAAGYKLSFSETEVSIPVSRMFSANVIKQLKDLQ